MKYRVETRATVIRHRIVEANSPEEAGSNSTDAAIEYEEDENEETIGVFEVEE